MSDDQVTGREQCPKCAERGADNSGDNLARYADGHAHCYSCDYHEASSTEGTVAPGPTKSPEFTPIAYESERLSNRRISSSTCSHFGYGTGHDFNGSPVHVCDVRGPTGQLLAQKIRGANKSFWTNGSLETKPLIGMHLWSGGKQLVVTEGEIDMLSYAEVSNCKWPVVSLPNGAASARKVITENLEYLKAYESVILMFDMDEPGQNAAKECADILMSVTDVRLAKLPLKDASECLQEGRHKEVMQAVWNAQPHMPDGLLSVSDILERRKNKTKEPGLPWFMDGLNKSSNGRNYGQIITIGAGTGVGKTDFTVQQMDFDIRELKQKVAGFFLENDAEEIAELMAGKADGRLYYEEGHPHYDMVAECDAAIERYDGYLQLYDNFGICAWDSIKSKIVFLINQGYRLFYVDHLTALATGGDRDEKEELEDIMSDSAEIAKRYDIIIHFISHLTTPEGKSHEEGGRVTIKQLKGSRAIGYWSHQVIGFERDQQAEGEQKYVTTARQLKRRGFGKGVGSTTLYRYDFETGRHIELSRADLESPFEEEPF